MCDIFLLSPVRFNMTRRPVKLIPVKIFQLDCFESATCIDQAAATANVCYPNINKVHLSPSY